MFTSRDTSTVTDVVRATTVVTPAHPGRDVRMLETAEWSVREQTIPPWTHTVTWDLHQAGAAATRQRGLDAVTTPWVAFLDSDDWFYPEHLEYLATGAVAAGADYVFSYFTVYDAHEAMRPDVDPLMLFGHQFDPAAPTQTTTTILVRTALAKSVGFQTQPVDRKIEGTDLRHGEDFEFTLGCVAQGARIVHGARRTWAWRHHGLNTGGLPGFGDGK